MQLSEIWANKGTYVALRVSPECNSRILKHCANQNITVDSAAQEQRMHTTVIYSRVKMHNVEVVPSKVYLAKFKDYEIFPTAEGKKVLVALLDAPSVVGRHLQLMKLHNGTYDFPVYKPHITLSYDYKGDDSAFESLEPMDFDILLLDEYTEDLNLEWN